MQVNIILVQDMVQLDITGPYEVLARTPGWSIDLVAESQAPVRTDRGLTILPTQTRATARPSDILVVPGGTGIDNAMLDPAWIAYAAREIGRAQYVFGICTGSLLLAATGALAGRKAGGHWQARDLLARFGVTPSDARMTRDGKFYTSGGVTSGIDMALRVVADVAGEETARKIQLAIEYDPAPPFAGGTPATSPAPIVAAVLEQSRARRAEREAKVEKAVAALKK
ncbi:MAG: DJ-1/PfpI family protein [Pseudorhodoplanes sp.]|nr:MAG: DJ-1/PfpI family protein [Pseudorhodoplanes sp.]